MPSTKSFAEFFFSRFGAQISPGQDELIVDLPPELAAVFGKPRLYLVFPEGEPRPLSPTEDLLVYGSRTFERMLSLLEGRGEVTCFGLPALFLAQPDGDLPLPLHNCRPLETSLQTGTDPFYIINFRAVYSSDEKQEEFITLVLDAAGEPCSAQIAALLQGEALPLPDSPLAIEPEALRRILDRAGELVYQQVDARAAKLEHDLRPRLQTALLRLVAFYRRLADEVDSGAPEQDAALRAEVQQELVHKIAEELERYRLQATVTPMSCAVILAPVARYHLVLATRYSRHSGLTLKRNLYTGEVEPLPCYNCQEPLDHISLCDRGGHPVHTFCLQRCIGCEQEVCLACGITPCAICAHPVCDACIAVCSHCQRRLCAAHVASCAICGEPYCETHSFQCGWCGQHYCCRCGQEGECETCRRALAAEAGELPPLAGIKFEAEHYDWQRAENKAYNIYIGHSKGILLSSLRGSLVVVTDPAGKLLVQRHINLWQRLICAITKRGTVASSL